MAGSGVGVIPATATHLRPFAAALFAAADEATDDASPRASFTLGPATITVDFASQALREQLALAWTPLPSWDGDGDPARLQVLDVASCGPPPRPPWPADAYRPRDEIAGFGDETLEVAFHLTTGTLMLWDAAARRGVWWTRSAAAIPSWERAMPLRNLLRWALRDRGLSLAHGAVIGRGGRYALLAGASGAGKSTLALAAQQAGWEFISDDHCVIDPLTLCAAPLTAFAKATPATLALLPGLADLPRPVADTPEGKAVVAPPLATPAGGASLALLAVPHVTGHAGSPAQLDAGAAMAALAPTTLLQFPGSRARDRELLGQVVRALPAWSLPSGPSLAATLDALGDLLESA